MEKVCHVTSAHSRYDTRIFQKECISLVKEGYEVYLIVNDDLYDEKKNGVNIVSSGLKPSCRKERFIDSHVLLWKKIKQIDADLYHFHDPDLIPLMLKVKKNKIVIFDSHELYAEQIAIKSYIPKVLRKVVSTVYSIYEKNALGRIDAVVFPCTINGGHPFKDKCKNTVFLNNYPMIEELIELSTVDKNQGCELLDNSEHSVCCIGSISEDRGIVNLIEACVILNVRLILGGHFESEELKSRILLNPRYNSVIDYRGYCARSQVIDIYKEATIGASTILPIGQYALAENLPTKAYEWMGAGIPFVISDVPFTHDFIQKYKCGLLIDPQNIDSICNGVRYLINNPKEARQLGQNGRKAVLEKFNWGIEEKTLFALYRDLLEK